MTKQSQALRLAHMLCNSQYGLTSVDIQERLGTVCPRKRISDVKKIGAYKVIKLETDRHGCKFAYRAERVN